MSSHRTTFERNAPTVAVVDAALKNAEDGCFWLADVSDAPTFPVLSRHHRADLVVVGGGFAGLWTAIRAKQRDPGRSVVLLEAVSVGWGASGRNGGFCDASITHGEENGRQRWPDEYDTLERLGRDNLDGIEATVSEHALDVDFERTGELDVAIETHQVEWLRDSAGPHHRFLDVAQVRALVNSPTYLAGLLDVRDRPDTALLHPGKMVYELARLAASLGVEIFENSAVTSLESTTAHTLQGSVRGAQVALMTNVYPAVLKRWRPFTVPVYDYVVMTEPLNPEQLAEIGWHGRHGLADLANQFHYYRLSADNRILFGGYDAIYYAGKRVRASYEQRPDSYRRLVSHLLTTFPQLEGIKVSHTWAGPIDTSTRFAAFFATARGGRVAHSAGFTGLGVGATRFAADTLLDLLGKQSTERTELEMVRKLPMPFPPEPLAAAGINLTRWSLDRADHRNGRRNLWLRGLDTAGLGFDS